MRTRLLTIPLVLLALPCAALAALVNINTADDATLETLPGIGPSKAASIIGYRDANGPFATIAGIQDVSGIGPSTYANIEPLITVGSANSPEPAASAPAAGGTSEPAYVPPPTALSVDAGGDRQVPLDVPVQFSAAVSSKSGAADQAARVVWSFGDGSSAEGVRAEKLYRYAGTYVVTATASDGATTGRAEFVVTAAPALVRIASISGAGITLANDGMDELDLSGWRLSTGLGTFRIPTGMKLLPGARVLIPFSITNLPVATEATLAYPDGLIAARYPTPVQPSVATTSSNRVQRVEPAISTVLSDSAHEEVTAVGAPAATNGLAAAGALMPASSTAAVAPAARATASNGLGPLLHSPWTYGLLGVIAVAGGAFVLL